MSKARGRICTGVLSLMAFGVSLAEPCSIVCTRDTSASALLSHRYVLLGKVVETKWEGAEGTFVLEPVRVWKGGWPGDKRRFRAATSGGSASCGYPLVEGAYYIILATAEPQQIGLCDHEPVPLAAGLKEAAALDRERHLPPLAVPDEALLSPSEIACPTDIVNNMIDREIGKAEIIVVGRIASIDMVSHPGGHTVATGRMETMRTLKGRTARSFLARFEYESYLDLRPTEPAIWFVGPRLPNRNRVGRSWQWSLDSEGSIRSRLRRWKVMGRGCAGPS